ncbi:MFS transporter [uncultured Jatrophihabitans sp.]|uniref:MFS transporter n=1 Tax=uncultured Jatrophihabitans sp. TaxID=1610747 RepID=UPI0035CB7589
MRTYQAILAIPDVRRVLLLGLLVRVPMWAGNVVLTLHVVTHLHRSYGAAGLLVGVGTCAASISNPWRGRRLDRLGLRRAVAPSLIVGFACWAVAPFVGYWPLMALASLAMLFLLPSFSIVRQALMHAVPDEHRKSALSVDSVVVELSFMVGPALGVLLATYWTTPAALFTCEYLSLAGGLVLWLGNPPLRAAQDVASAHAEERVPVRSWLRARVLVLLAMSAAAVLVLTATDVGIVAALRAMHHQPWIGWELTLWGLGSALGGLLYGAIRHTLPVALLLALLAAATIPVVVATEPLLFGALLIVAGFFCAPTLTATVDALSRAVPERVRGEALGWHGSAMTAGGALGAPIAGFAIDRFGWHGGFVVAGCVGLAAAAAGAAFTSRGGGVGGPVPGRTGERARVTS